MPRKSKNKTIRSSKHTLKYINKGKGDDLSLFIKEYHRLLGAIIDHIWEHGIPGTKFNVNGGCLDVPSYLPNDFLKSFDSWFTARMKQCAGKQSCAMINSAVKKQAKRFYVLKKLQRTDQDFVNLQRKIDNTTLVKPNVENAKLELDPRFVDFEVCETGEFDEFIRVRTIGNKMVLKLPVRHTKVSRRWDSLGERKNSIRIDNNSLWLLYDYHKQPITGTKTVGCDQGMKKVVVLSNGQITEPCPHGHSLDTIQQKLARKQKGSKAFKRAQEHRKNHINYSLNKLDYQDIEEIRLEDIYDLRKNKRQFIPKMIHWSYPLIKDKLTTLGETEGFEISLVSSPYRSQRCNICGHVRKDQRRSESFKCGQCGNATDADLNAALNLELDLPEVPNWVRQQKLNREGFYWTQDGISTSVGHESIVRDTT